MATETTDASLKGIQESRRGKKPVTFWLPDADHGKLKASAALQGQTIQELMEVCARAQIEKLLR